MRKIIFIPSKRISILKKIGILHGKERTFPQAFVERVNEKTKKKDFIAESVVIDRVAQGEATDYAVIIDRISQDVPFYKAYLKNAALNGTAVINNPFWWSADEKFFNNCIATKVGVPVPKTVLLPSHKLPPDTNEHSFTNLFGHYKWSEAWESIGFPAYMKPHSGGGWKSVYKLNSLGEFYAKHPETGELVMLLQEEIQFTDYFRCYCIGQTDVRIMPYEPRNPHHLRYVAQTQAQGPEGKKLLATVHDYVLRLNKALGYDFNTAEFAVRDGIPYAIDFCNPAPDADVHSVGQENFDWVVEAAANMAIAKAKASKPGIMNLTWGDFVNQSVQHLGLGSPAAMEAKSGTSTEKPKKTTKKAS